MAAIREALEHRSAEHPVFYEDEVDIHLNPKIGADWQVRGECKMACESITVWHQGRS